MHSKAHQCKILTGKQKRILNCPVVFSSTLFKIILLLSSFRPQIIARQPSSVFVQAFLTDKSHFFAGACYYQKRQERQLDKLSARRISASAHASCLFPSEFCQHFQKFSKNRHYSFSKGKSQITLGMTENGTPEQTKIIHSLSEFLTTRKQRASKGSHFVLGNEAGDADSIISALTLAYVLQHQQLDATPIVSITRNDLETQRPETTLLLDLSGISSKDNFLYIDEVKDIVQSGSDGEKLHEITLVDHNQLNDGILPADMKWNVNRIFDHHLDQCAHLESCPPDGTERRIAFENDTNKASVASTCTLVVELMQEIWTAPSTNNGYRYPPELSALLLGVILLDSVNMIPAAGKVTPRDEAAIRHLLGSTDWTKLSSLKSILSQETFQPDTTALFNMLQQAKFAPEFWNALSVRDCLRLDYKKFSQVNRNGDETVFGVSTILMPLPEFQTKTNLVKDVANYMDEMSIDFLGMMFGFTDEKTGSKMKRQLMLCGKGNFVLNDLVSYLFDEGSLQLTEMVGRAVRDEEGKLSVRSFEQGNVQASRKQVAPILIQFFDYGRSSL